MENSFLMKKIKNEKAEAKRIIKEATIQKKQEQQIFESKLILEVEAQKSIYNKTCPEYKNRDTKASAWHEISLILGRPVAECQKKWATLRDTFSFNLKTSKISVSGSAAGSDIKWHHFDSMKFLIPFVKIPDNNCGNYSNSKENNKIIVIDEVESNLEQSLQETDQSWNESYCSVETLKKRIAEDDENAFGKILKAIENLPAETPSESPMTDFFASINKLTNHFTREQQIDFQVECLNLVKKFR